MRVPSTRLASIGTSRPEASVEAMTAVAYARWDLVFHQVAGMMHVSVVGPESRARVVAVPDAELSFGINSDVTGYR